LEAISSKSAFRFRTFILFFTCKD